jgi:rifampicin phosphotransferase
MTYVLPLPEITIADADRVGRKAAVLGELRAAGFPVPPGFAVTIDGCHATDEVIAAEVRAALEQVGDCVMVVRSSGIEEDLAGMSFAGQYESILGVRGVPAVVAAIRTCWASAISKRVLAYRERRRSTEDTGGGPHETAGTAAMGVLVQAMVDPVAAGVAFSSNPITGDHTEAVLSATRGLSDQLTAGEVSAEEWAVRGDDAVRTGSVPGRGPVVDAAQARQVARLSRRVAGYLGGPQDIEWAADGATLWVLQARPITALPAPGAPPVPIPIAAPPGYCVRHPSLDRPWTALERSVFLPVFDRALPHIVRYTTGLSPSAHCVGGWVYMSVPPDSAEAFAARLERIAADIAAGRPEQLIRTWHETWKAELAREIGRLGQVDLGCLPDSELDSHIRAVVELFTVLHDRYFQLTGAGIAVSAAASRTCTELLDWSPEQAAQLRGGLAGDHMSATVELARLAQLAADRPALRHFLDSGEADPGRLAAIDADFAARFAGYLRTHARRCIGFDLTQPTLAERPAILLSLLRTRIHRPYDFAAESEARRARVGRAVTEARAALAERGAAERDRFEAAAQAMASAAPVRDEKAHYAACVWALLRYTALELGRRLVDRGLTDRADDALHLELDEARAALCGTVEQRARVRHHRGQYAWALAHPGPPGYGQPPPPPAVAPDLPLSPGARQVMRAAIASMSAMQAAPAAGGGEGALRGLPASAGSYLGPVRVIRSVAEFGKLRDGDVLVCPETTAQWSLLFPSIGALVTDRGSMLSHPAILAREYAVPAVLATGAGTAQLRDGELVLVDGSAGVVRRAAPTS